MHRQGSLRADLRERVFMFLQRGHVHATDCLAHPWAPYMLLFLGTCAFTFGWLYSATAAGPIAFYAAAAGDGLMLSAREEDDEVDAAEDVDAQEKHVLSEAEEHVNGEMSNDDAGGQAGHGLQGTEEDVMMESLGNDPPVGAEDGDTGGKTEDGGDSAPEGRPYANQRRHNRRPLNTQVTRRPPPPITRRRIPRNEDSESAVVQGRKKLRGNTGGQDNGNAKQPRDSEHGPRNGRRNEGRDTSLSVAGRPKGKIAPKPPVVKKPRLLDSDMLARSAKWSVRHAGNAVDGGDERAADLPDPWMRAEQQNWALIILYQHNLPILLQVGRIRTPAGRDGAGGVCVCVCV